MMSMKKLQLIVKFQRWVLRHIYLVKKNWNWNESNVVKMSRLCCKGFSGVVQILNKYHICMFSTPPNILIMMIMKRCSLFEIKHVYSVERFWTGIVQVMLWICTGHCCKGICSGVQILNKHHISLFSTLLVIMMTVKIFGLFLLRDVYSGEKIWTSTIKWCCKFAQVML